MNTYKVSINHNDIYGYIAYDPENKKINVHIEDPQIKQGIIDYLARPHLINEPEGAETHIFTEREYTARNSKHDFQIVLSRMWNSLPVHVNWSIPVNIAD